MRDYKSRNVSYHHMNNHPEFFKINGRPLHMIWFHEKKSTLPKFDFTNDELFDKVKSMFDVLPFDVKEAYLEKSKNEAKYFQMDYFEELGFHIPSYLWFVENGFALPNVDLDKAIMEVKSKFDELPQDKTTQMAIISFYEVDFSFDLPYLQKSLAESHASLHTIVQKHLTDKSLGRIDEVFEFFSDGNFLETCFRVDSPYKEIIGKIVGDLNKAMDSGDL